MIILRLFLIVFLSILVTQTQGSRIYGSFKDANYPESCVISDKIILSHLETMKDPSVQCGLIICGKNSIVEFKSCSLQPVASNCKLTQLLDPSRPFPECCERGIECRNSNTTF
ncbi:uncharacterized protein ACRADG_004368 [Cochliomyia hominivorax]